MISSKAIGAALAAILLAGLCSTEARAQSAPATPSATGSAESPAPVIKPVPKLHQAMPKATPQAVPAKAASAPVGNLDYPPCSKTVTDRCIQLWQPDLAKTYPQCAKVKGQSARAACIETAYKETRK
jgi:hypothetical protein